MFMLAEMFCLHCGTKTKGFIGRRVLHMDTWTYAYTAQRIRGGKCGEIYLNFWGQLAPSNLRPFNHI